MSERTFTPRGFEDFTKFKDANGADVVLRESSEVGPMRAWLFCHVGEEGKGRVDRTPYLDATQALELASGLLSFVIRAKEAKREETEV
jgi:hypothetical protein